MNPYQIEDLQAGQASKLEVLAEVAANPATSVFKVAARRAVDAATEGMTEEQLRELLAAAIRYVRPLK